MVAELIVKALFHSSLVERILGMVFDYERGTITIDEIRRELDRIDDEADRMKTDHWAIVAADDSEDDDQSDSSK